MKAQRSPFPKVLGQTMRLLLLYPAYVRRVRSDRRDQDRAVRGEAGARASWEAQLTAAYLRRGTSDVGSHWFQVKNIGKAAATDLVAVLINERGEVVSTLPDRSYIGGSGLLDVGEKVDFELPLSADSQQRDPVFLHFKWNDG